MNEAKAAGVADIVDLEPPSEDQLEKDLLLLAKEQEKLAAELRKAYEEELEAERDERRQARDEEMEKKIREMNMQFTPKAEEELHELNTVGIVYFIQRQKFAFHLRVYF